MDVETFDSLDGWRQKSKMTLMTLQEHGWHPGLKLTKNSVKEQEKRCETENNRKPISQVKLGLFWTGNVALSFVFQSHNSKILDFGII